MSKKRTAPETPAKNKRLKSHNNQSRLDTFFGSPAVNGVLTSSVKSPSPKPNAFVQGSSKSTLPSSQNASLAPISSDQSNYIEISDDDNVKTTSQSQLPAVRSKPAPIIPAKTSKTSTDKKRMQPEMPKNIVFHPLDIDPVHYDPDCQPFPAGNVPYALLTRAFVGLSNTRSRIAIINILTNTLRTIIVKSPTSLLPSVYLLSNALRPQFIPAELGIGSSILSRSLQQISGLTPAALRRLYNNMGDPGDVAFAAKSNIRTLIPHAPLTITHVYESLLRISRSKGQGAAKEKQKIIEKLLLAANGEEVRYLTRTLCQNLRVGAVRTSILTALARAIALMSSLTPDNAVEPHLHVSETHLSILRASKGKDKGKDSCFEELKMVYKNAESVIKQVYVKHPSYDKIIPALLEQGLYNLLDRVPVTVGVPLLPMLGSPIRSLTEIHTRLGDKPFAAEFKYDGQRAQIHAFQETPQKVVVKLFSRHLEDMTDKYPDVIILVKEMLEEHRLSSFILDAEIVAIDPVTGTLKTFQELSGRARKEVLLSEVKVPVCVFAFDLMYLNGEVSQPHDQSVAECCAHEHFSKPMLSKTFRERRQSLRSSFNPRRVQRSAEPIAQFDFVESCESENSDVSIEEFMAQAVEQKCEGLMIKLLDKAKVLETDEKKHQSRLKALPSTYEPDLRTSAWLKLKKDYIDTMGDSIDVIPVGAWYGNGRKVQWWSPVLFALWDPQKGGPVALCKCMSGFTDAFYKSMKERYSEESDFCSRKRLWECEMGGFKPDVYFRPSEVWEIRGADITESPVSVAAQSLTSSGRGLSLRFPRFIRVREDKKIEDANTPAFLVSIWTNQQGKTGTSPANDDGDLIDADFESSDYSAGEEFDELER
ncbi:ATP-dependent DNA ligase [Panaeolus papilionaceus]|nr:ATP-dependent DNA ligase [Panaeolus papilionaceus]